MIQTKRFIFGLLIALVLFELYQLKTESTLFTSYLANLVFQHNLHEVVPHRFYRSAEMSASSLSEIIKSKGIKTVIDLRLGKDDPDENGKVESQTVAEHGAVYQHIPLAGSRIPSVDTVRELLKVYESAETPVLVHCSSGTHRAGVASAIWLMDREGKSFEEARAQLSPKYGFFEFERELKTLFSGQPTIDNLLWNYAAQRSGGDDSFRAWVNHGMARGENIGRSGFSKCSVSVQQDLPSECVR